MFGKLSMLGKNQTFLGVVGMVLGIYLLVAIGEHITFPGDVAGIEQLRKDAPRLAQLDAEHVTWRVIEANRSIAKHQEYNKAWWADPAVADGWDKIKPIVLP